VGRLSMRDGGVLAGKGPLQRLAGPAYGHPDSPLGMWLAHNPETDTFYDGWAIWQPGGVRRL